MGIDVWGDELIDISSRREVFGTSGLLTGAEATTICVVVIFDPLCTQEA
jgi:hypothetical protein